MTMMRLLSFAASSVLLSLLILDGQYHYNAVVGFVIQAPSLSRSSLLSSSSSTTTTDDGTWSPSSWQSKRVAPQMPSYDSTTTTSTATATEELDRVLTTLRDCSPLVFAGEVRTLHEQLARAAQGQGFVLMGGDCAGTDEFNVDNVRDTFRVILQMGLILTFGSSLPIIKMGRMAGQFSKPVGGIEEPNDNDETESEQEQPGSILKMYHQSAQTLNILRAFSTGGYADIGRLQAWNLDFVEKTDEASRYRKLAAKVDESLRFMKAIGVNTASPTFTQTEFFTSHECLNLHYEESLTRQDSITNRYYDCSAHMLWVGERFRSIDGAHLEFVRGVGNPLGVVVSDRCTPDELIRICDVANPLNVPGKLTLIVRMGANKVRQNLAGLVRAVQREGKSVVWISDPCGGNTRKLGSSGSTSGTRRTSDFETIRDELRAFFDVHDEMGSHPGGVHLEMTGEDVMECVGGVSDVTEAMLFSRRNNNNNDDNDNKDSNVSQNDPRLNGAQALELAFLIAERMRLRAGLPPIE